MAGDLKKCLPLKLSPGSAQVGPTSTNFGQRPAGIAQNWHRRPKLARTRPTLARNRRNSTRVGPGSSVHGPISDNFRAMSRWIRPTYARKRPKLSRIQPNLARVRPNLGDLDKRTENYPGPTEERLPLLPFLRRAREPSKCHNHTAASYIATCATPEDHNKQTTDPWPPGLRAAWQCRRPARCVAVAVRSSPLIANSCGEGSGSSTRCPLRVSGRFRFTTCVLIGARRFISKCALIGRNRIVTAPMTSMCPCMIRMILGWCICFRCCPPCIVSPPWQQHVLGRLALVFAGRLVVVGACANRCLGRALKRVRTLSAPPRCAWSCAAQGWWRSIRMLLSQVPACPALLRRGSGAAPRNPRRWARSQSVGRTQRGGASGAYRLALSAWRPRSGAATARGRPAGAAGGPKRAVPHAHRAGCPKQEPRPQDGHPSTCGRLEGGAPQRQDTAPNTQTRACGPTARRGRKVPWVNHNRLNGRRDSKESARAAVAPVGGTTPCDPSACTARNAAQPSAYNLSAPVRLGGPERLPSLLPMSGSGSPICAATAAERVGHSTRERYGIDAVERSTASRWFSRYGDYPRRGARGSRMRGRAFYCVGAPALLAGAKSRGGHRASLAGLGFVRGLEFRRARAVRGSKAAKPPSAREAPETYDAGVSGEDAHAEKKPSATPASSAVAHKVPNKCPKAVESLPLGAGNRPTFDHNRPDWAKLG